MHILIAISLVTLTNYGISFPYTYLLNPMLEIFWVEFFSKDHLVTSIKTLHSFLKQIPAPVRKIPLLDETITTAAVFGNSLLFFFYHPGLPEPCERARKALASFVARPVSITSLSLYGKATEYSQTYNHRLALYNVLCIPSEKYLNFTHWKQASNKD